MQATLRSKRQKNQSGTSAMSQKIILLKNKTTPFDPYDDLLTKTGFQPTFIPLLKHTHLPNQCLEILNSEQLLELDFLIITSQRAVECVQQSILHRLSKDDKKLLLSKPVYTVGPATAKFITEVGFEDVRGGLEAGNGSILSDIIIDDLKNNSGTSNILFLVGEVRRDIIPKKLSPYTNINLQEVVIYKTECLEDISDRFNEHFAPSAQNVVVFFSPQGTEYIIPQLQNLDANEVPKIISIGPTTEKYLISNSIKVDQVCAKPEANSLLTCVKSVLESQ
ncbi:hypothetical protein ACO0QE_002327 [Hanseniaspora vineae]